MQRSRASTAAEDFQWATRTEDRNRLWARGIRPISPPSAPPRLRAVSTDVCVPVSGLTECIGRDRGRHRPGVRAGPMFGHVGDGNFHCMILVAPDSDADLAEAKAFNDRLVDRALAMEGTCTGEHGSARQAPRPRRRGGPAIAVMQGLKHALDPAGVFNPDKVLAPDK